MECEKQASTNNRFKMIFFQCVAFQHFQHTCKFNEIFTFKTKLTNSPHDGLADDHKRHDLLNAPHDLVQFGIGVLVRRQQLSVQGIHAHAAHQGHTLVQFTGRAHHWHALLDDLFQTKEHLASHKVDIVAHIDGDRGHAVVFEGRLEVLFNAALENLA